MSSGIRLFCFTLWALRACVCWLPSVRLLRGGETGPQQVLAFTVPTVNPSKESTFFLIFQEEPPKDSLWLGWQANY